MYNVNVELSNTTMGGNAMEKYLTCFAERLSILREEKGLSLRALAAELQISKSALHQYENCIGDPQLGIVKKIAEYFQVDLNWLIGDSEERNKKNG